MKQHARPSSSTGVSSQASSPSRVSDQDLMGNAAIQEQLGLGNTGGGSGSDLLLGSAGAPANLTPGILFSNTSRSDLKTDTASVDLWKSQGYEHSMQYDMPLTLSSLTSMGMLKQLNTSGAKASKLPSNRTDLIEGPRGSVKETGTTSLILRGGPDVGEPQVDLTVSNNGVLNLWRLALAASDMMKSFGVRLGAGGKLDYGGRNFEVVCNMTMGNVVSDDHSRDHGFVAGVPADLNRRVNETIEKIVGAVILQGAGRSTGQYDREAHKNTSGEVSFHPMDVLAGTFRQDKPDIRPVEGETMKWVTGDAIGANASASIQKTWLTQAVGHNTWFTSAPDFAPLLNGLHVQYGPNNTLDDKQLARIVELVKQCAELLVQDETRFDPTFLDLEPDMKGKFITHYQRVIREAFARETGRQVRNALEQRTTADANPVQGTASPGPAKGDRMHTEGH